MKVEMKYKDILFEVFGETSINNTWQIVGGLVRFGNF